jgi:hypothetical protein
MPCYSQREGQDSPIYITERVIEVNQADKILIEELKHKNRKLEASICAIINELEVLGITNRVLSTASKRGLIDLMSFWTEHSKEDTARIAEELHRFSEHEQQIIKKLLAP